MRTRSQVSPPQGGRAPGGAPPGTGEGGFMIVLALLVLFGLTIMGMSVIMGGNIESRLAANENAGARAFYAADAGLSQGVTALNNGGVTLTVADYALLDYPAGNGWIYPTSTTADLNDGGTFYRTYTLPNGTNYRWRMKFKQDERDFDADCPSGAAASHVCYTEVVYYNNRFKYLPSKYTGNAGDEGYPVIEIISEGFSRPGDAASASDAERRLALEIGRDKYNVMVEGAVTARSNVRLTGNIGITGDNHDINGLAGGTCGTNMPGVFVDTGKTITEQGAANPYGTTPTLVNPDARYLPSTPWDVLGLDDEAELLRIMEPQVPLDPGSAPTEDLQGFLYVKGDIDVGNTAAGKTVVLIVHNPLFDAAVYECSVPTDENGNPNPKYDTGSAKYDPKLDNNSAQYDPAWRAAREPAVLAMHGNDIFKGIIIADKINAINGTSDVIGAVVSLTSVGADILGNGAATIKYSCEAITAAASMGYSQKLVWRRL